MREYSVEIGWNNGKITVFFDYAPEEKEVRYYSDGSGYPGCPEEFQITKVEYNGVDITDLFDEDDFESMEDTIKRDSYEDSI